MNEKSMLHGLPPEWLSFAQIAIFVITVLFIIKSFFKVNKNRQYDGFVFNILSIKVLDKLIKKRWFQLIFQVIPVILLLIVILTGLFGVQNGQKNLSTILTWIIWWALIIFDIVLMGRMWCMVCPWYAISTWLKRHSFFNVKKEPMSLNIKWPKSLKNIYFATFMFILLTWLELGFGVTSSPLATGILAILMTLMVIAPSLIFEKMSFCQYGCLVGRICGLYSTFSPIEIRSKDKDVCLNCKTKDCYNGNENGYPCPTSQCLHTMDKNTYCNVCTECIKTCPNNNVSFNIRPFGSDLINKITPQKDESFMALVMISLTSFHGLTMTPVWNKITDHLKDYFSLNFISAFTIGMLTVLIIPFLIFYFFSAQSSQFLNEKSNNNSHPFLHYSYALIPIALLYHLSHNTHHIIFEGASLLHVISDPFGWGWNIFNTANMPVTPFFSKKVVWAIQIFFIVTGHLYAIRITYQISKERYDKNSKRALSLILFSICMLVYTYFNLWLLSQPMVMRTFF